MGRKDRVVRRKDRHKGKLCSAVICNCFDLNLVQFAVTTLLCTSKALACNQRGIDAPEAFCVFRLYFVAAQPYSENGALGTLKGGEEVPTWSGARMNVLGSAWNLYCRSLDTHPILARVIVTIPIITGADAFAQKAEGKRWDKRRSVLALLCCI